MVERTRHYRTAGKDDLTPRQREVLQMVAAGKTNPEIAEQLGITLDGAKFHIREILAKLHVDSREEAAEWWKAERGMGTRVASFLRALSPLGWLKPLAIGSAIGGTTLGLVAVGFAMNGGGDDDVPIGAVLNGPACETATLTWTTNTAMDGDPNVGLRYALSASAPDECVLDAVIGVSAFSANPDAAGGTFSFTIGQAPIAVTIEKQLLGRSPTPLIVGRVSNTCHSGQFVMLVITTPSQSSYFLDPPLPPCLDPVRGSAFTAAWAANEDARLRGQPVPVQPWWSNLPRYLGTAPTAMPTPARRVILCDARDPTCGSPTSTPTPQGQTIMCDVRTGNCPVPPVPDCDFPGCLVAAEILRDVDGFLARVESFRVSSDPPGVYSLKGGERRVLSLSQFKAEARDFLGLSPTLIAVGDAGKNGILDLVFLTDDGRAFSVAIEPRAAAPFVPIGIAHWDAVPPDGAYAEASFGPALYRRVSP